MGQVLVRRAADFHWRLNFHTPLRVVLLGAPEMRPGPGGRVNSAPACRAPPLMFRRANPCSLAPFTFTRQRTRSPLFARRRKKCQTRSGGACAVRTLGAFRPCSGAQRPEFRSAIHCPDGSPLSLPHPGRAALFSSPRCHSSGYRRCCLRCARVLAACRFFFCFVAVSRSLS